MNQFQRAVAIIRNHMTEYTHADVEQPMGQYGRIPCAYAFIDMSNQTYHVGKALNLERIQQNFRDWRTQGKVDKLPSKLRKVIDLPSTPRFFMVVDPYGGIQKRLLAELTTIGQHA